MTSLLTREEMHKRVDSLFDQLEEHYDEEGLAIVGGIGGTLQTHAPSDTDDTYRAQTMLKWGNFAFDKLHPMNTALRQPGQSDLLGTLLVPRSDAARVVEAAVFDDDAEARDALKRGEPDAWDGGDGE